MALICLISTLWTVRSRSRAISHLTRLSTEITLLTWLAYEVSMTCRALLVTFRLEAAFWTSAVFQVICFTSLTRSRHFFSLFALSAILRSFSAFQFFAQLTLCICITFTLVAAVFADTLVMLLRT